MHWIGNQHVSIWIVTLEISLFPWSEPHYDYVQSSTMMHGSDENLRRIEN
jgi:hypothetical protein